MRRPALAAAVFLVAAVVVVTLAVQIQARRARPHVEKVTTLPLATPATVLPASRDTLPEQRGLRRGQVYLGWRLLDDEAAPDTLTLHWDNTLDPPLPGCGSRPVAVHVEETATEIRIGLIGRVPPPASNCLAVGAAATIDVRLARPPDHRTVYRLAG